MSINKVATYTTSDGQSFADRGEAVKHEDAITLNGIVSTDVQIALNAAGFVVVKKPIPRKKAAPKVAAVA